MFLTQRKIWQILTPLQARILQNLSPITVLFVNVSFVRTAVAVLLANLLVCV
jgi:hypothetical protein